MERRGNNMISVGKTTLGHVVCCSRIDDCGCRAVSRRLGSEVVTTKQAALESRDVLPWPFVLVKFKPIQSVQVYLIHSTRFSLNRIDPD
jgi:hypothetical protein